jgi:hypothetical protein
MENEELALMQRGGMEYRRADPSIRTCIFELRNWMIVKTVDDERRTCWLLGNGL